MDHMALFFCPKRDDGKSSGACRGKTEGKKMKRKWIDLQLFADGGEGGTGDQGGSGNAGQGGSRVYL